MFQLFFFKTRVSLRFTSLHWIQGSESGSSDSSGSASAPAKRWAVSGWFRQMRFLCFQVFSDVFRCFQVFSNVFSCFLVILEVTF